MPEAPGVGESNVLPSPKDDKDRDMNIAIQRFMNESSNVSEYLLKNPIKTVTAAYTIEGSDFTILADASGGTFAVTLPPAGKHAKEVFRIKKIDATANVTIVSTDNIDGTTPITLTTQYEGRIIQSDGTTYWVIGSF